MNEVGQGLHICYACLRPGANALYPSHLKVVGSPKIVESIVSCDHDPLFLWNSLDLLPDILVKFF